MKLKFIIDKEYDKSFVKNKKILQYMDNQYETSTKFLELTKNLYQNSWNEINDKFSDYIVHATGYDWFYKEYQCVISVYNIGVSNWGDTPKIVRIWKENPYCMRRITAHELILSHYFEIHKRHYKNEQLTDGQIWALAEIAAWALTSLRPDVKNFWPWDTAYYTNHNYPNLVDIQLELKDSFFKDKDFNKYIKNGIKLIKKYPKMRPHV